MTLVPGYRQVESFGSDEDYAEEEEEEVSYVTLDLGLVEPTLLPSTSTYRLIGLDTSTPFLQLSGSIFKGRHDTLLGTELLFTEEKDHDANRRSLTHVGCTEQRIRFKEVRLREKVQERRESDIQKEVESMYVDMDPSDAVAPEKPPADPVEQPSSSKGVGAASPRKRKKASRKGKERAVEDNAMDTT